MGFSDINIRDLERVNMTADLLDSYNRYQKVTKVWRTENNRKVIKDISFIEDWNNEKKQKVILEELKEIICNGGYVFGAYDNISLIGFAAIGGMFLDENLEYVQLIQLHVSYEYRGKGIGKLLFQRCIDQALVLGAKKLCISGHSAIETQEFYSKMGCVDTEWIDTRLKELEPCDCQLEYLLKP